ncbi:MAG: SDR family oxidoreductase [Anaerolineales bacterium]|jgi:3-dehydrosphinganine reductase
MPFKNWNILITGGSSGIGLELSRQLATYGANISIFARSIPQLEKTLDEIQHISPGQHFIYPTDVSDIELVNQNVEQVITTSGIPDMLINCAGVVQPGYARELDLEVYHWMMDVNYFGAVNVTKAVLPGMLERGSGHIVNIATMMAVIGIGGYTAYSASKFALRGFSDALRMELKPHGINVAIAYPPDTDTPQLQYENKFKPEIYKKILDFVPAIDPVPPEKVARQILEGIKQNQEAIIPDIGMKLIFKLINILGRGVYPVLDWLQNMAIRQIDKSNKVRNPDSSP